MILEPTCGRGSFLLGAADAFPHAQKLLGIEINSEYLSETRQHVERRTDAKRFSLAQQDFFEVDWDALLSSLPSPILVVGNPPWVTNAAQGAIATGNLPEKSNLHQYRGLDAITGKSNFDISE